MPAVLATALVTGRSLASKDQRMPRPYEYGSVAVIYAAAGLVGEAAPQIGTAIAWGYLVALLLVPTSASFLNLITGGIKSPPGSTSQQQRAATQPTQ